MTRPDKAKALERLRKALGRVPELKRLRRHSPEFKKWRRDTRIAVANTFGEKSSHVVDLQQIQFSLGMSSIYTLGSEFQEAYVKGLESSEAILESMIEEIEEYWDGDERRTGVPDVTTKRPNDSRKVFVVHGHDETAREEIARFLEKLGLRPVILHEQPNKGRTIIEKFESYTDVGFAAVLLTPDDTGASAGNRDDPAPRARQNVILELGFFLGKLGRERVCALVKGEVETPSDYDGVVYTKLDDEDGWRWKLIRELRAAGYDIDANRAL